MLAAIEKADKTDGTHVGVVSPRAHRPLRAPPAFAFDDVSVEQIETMMEGQGSPARWLGRPSRSGGSLTHNASAPTLPRVPARARAGLNTGGPNVSSLNGLLSQKLGV